MDTLAMALRYRQSGLSVFSRPWGRKWGTEPWEQWQHEQPSATDVHRMFGNG